LDAGQDEDKKSNGMVSYDDSVLDKIGQLMLIMTNLLAKRENEKDKNVYSTSHIVHGVNVPLLEFLKLAPPIFKGVNNSKLPQYFLDAVWHRCEVMGCTDHHVVILASFMLEGKVVVNWYKSKRNKKAVDSSLMSWNEFSKMFLERFSPENVRDDRSYEFKRLV